MDNRIPTLEETYFEGNTQAIMVFVLAEMWERLVSYGMRTLPFYGR
jgi:dipeptide/tripeptide permease